MNPADCASRGVTAENIITHSLWWTVPWLAKGKAEWTRSIYHVPDENLQGFKNVIATSLGQLCLLSRIYIYIYIFFIYSYKWYN